MTGSTGPFSDPTHVPRSPTTTFPSIRVQISVASGQDREEDRRQMGLHEVFQSSRIRCRHVERATCDTALRLEIPQVRTVFEVL